MIRHLIFVLLTFLLFVECGSVLHISNIEESNINIQDLNPDSRVVELIAPYKDQLDAEMNEVIGVCEKTMTKRKPESTLGNWFCDVLITAAEKMSDKNIAFAVQNYGGLRIPNITAGDVTKRKIYELMPFDNTLVLVEVDYTELIKFINQMASSGGWPQSSQLRYEIKDGKAENILINGKPPKEDTTFWIAMPDYIANGGDSAFYLTDNPREEKGVFLRDAVIQQVIKNTAIGIGIMGDIDGRVIDNN